MAVARSSEYGGYDHEFVNQVPDKLMCSICTKVLCDPHLTGCCGQHFCESCLTHWFKRHKAETCPHCREENFVHLLNKALKREINLLEVYCSSEVDGCSWKGYLEDLRNHLESDSGCDYVVLSCPNSCTTKAMRRAALRDHLRSECYLRRYTCEYCGHKDTYQAITGKGGPKTVASNHYGQCPDFPVRCPNKCGEGTIRRKDIHAHRNNSCPLEPVECPNGCIKTLRWVKSQTVVKRKYLQQHLKHGCYLRKYTCEYCGRKDTYQAITGKGGPQDTADSHYSRCPNYPLQCPHGCGPQKIKRQDMNAHRNRCPLEPVECPNGCLQETSLLVTVVKRKSLQTHLESECYLRKYSCEYCGHEDTYQAITGRGRLRRQVYHYTSCSDYPLDCPYRCGVMGIKRKDMSSHTGLCPLKPVPCPFQEAGCETSLTCQDVEQHMATHVQQHLLLAYQTLQQQCNELQRENSQLKEEMAALKAMQK